MTQATGKRALQKRREDLLRGELTLRGVHRHLADAFARANYYGDAVDSAGYHAAARWVITMLFKIREEVAELQK